MLAKSVGQFTVIGSKPELFSTLTNIFVRTVIIIPIDFRC